MRMEDFVKIVIAVIGSGAFFTFLQFLITRRDNKKNKIDELCKKIDKELENQQSSVNERYETLQKEIRQGLDERENKGKERYLTHQESIQKLNEAIFQLTKNDTEQSKYMKYVGEELMGLAHDRLVHLTDHYQRRGYITLKEKATLEAIFKPYHEGLGGNGDGEQGYRYAMSLPVVTDIQAHEMDTKIKRGEEI